VFVTDSGEFELDCCSDTDFIELSYDLSIKSALYSCRYVINLDRCIPGCIGLDLDNDGICDEDDCWPDNATLSFGPGDSCDDGNPFTVDDSYNSNCECVGNPLPPGCNNRPGKLCDDGDPLTYGDAYNEQCECTGTPIPPECGDVVPDDGCPLTEDVIEDCVVINIPPDPSDGCHLTYDYFDQSTCTIVNVPPYVENDCPHIHSYFDARLCQIIITSIPCDDGDPTTYGDTYNEQCECIGTPLPPECGDVVADDGCALTEDVVGDNCVIMNIPPDPNDGCYLTYDYFDPATCTIVNLPPQVENDCPHTQSYFDPYLCEIITTSIPCDDGNPFTYNDKYDENCECKGKPECDDEIPQFQPKNLHCNGVFLCDIEIGIGTQYVRSSDVENDPDFGDPLSGNVCVIGDFFVDTDFTFQNAEVNISPGVSISVLRQGGNFGANAKVLNIDNSHLFSCDGMWNNIWVGHFATLNSFNGSVIEDANIGVNAHNSIGCTISLVNTTFQNNRTGLNMARRTQGANGPDLVRLERTVFRDGIFGISTAGVNIAPQDAFNNTFRNLTTGILSQSGGATNTADDIVVTIDLDFTRFIETTTFGVFLESGSLLLDDGVFTDTRNVGISIGNGQQVFLNNLNISGDYNEPFIGLEVNGLDLGSALSVRAANINLQSDDDSAISGIVVHGAQILPASTIHIAFGAGAGRFNIGSTGGYAIDLEGDFPLDTDIDIFGNNFFCNNFAIRSVGQRSNLHIYANSFRPNGHTGQGLLLVFGGLGTNNIVMDNNFVNQNFGYSRFSFNSRFNGVHYCNNDIWGTNGNGFVFENTNLAVDFQGNRMFATSVPLLLRNNPFIGPQFHRGNQWFDWDTGGIIFSTITDALCEGCTPFVAMDNQFDVHQAQTSTPTIESPFHPERIIPDNNDEWFIQSNGTPATFCTTMLTEPDPSEFIIIEDVSRVSQQEAIQDRALRYQLFRMYKNPENYSFHPEFQLFGNQLSGTDVYKFHQLDMLLDQAMITYDFSDSNFDSKAAILNEIQLELNELNPVKLHMSYEKIVIQSKLNKLLDSEYVPATAEVMNLVSIAELCPSEYGMVVEQARQLIPDCVEVTPCEVLETNHYEPNIVNEEQLDLRSNANGATVYPNPTLGIITIGDHVENVEALIFYDINGSIVSRLSIEAGGTYNLDIDSGSYIGELIFEDGSKDIFKLLKLDN